MKKHFGITSMLLATALLFAACSSPVSAPNEEKVEYPTKPIEVIVGFSAGGGNHLAVENLVPDAQKYLGQPLTVVCKPGAASALASSYVANAKPDGYTILNGTVALPISLYMETVDFSKEDFIGIAQYSNVVPALVVRADAPFDNAQELVEYANENPGEFSWGHSGVASTLHIAAANMMYSMGIADKVKEVPFPGTNEAIAAVLGGHIMGVSSFPSTVMEQVRAGNLKVIGVSSEERIAEFPDTPTFKEQGFDAVLTSTRGLFVRSDTPKEIIEILEKGFEQIIKDPGFIERATKLGEPPVYANSEDFTKIYYDQCDKIGELLKKLGLIN